MQEKYIFLIRHGETDLNAEDIFQGGKVDSELNEKGLSQALEFYNAYKDVPFKKIYTSTLKRSYQTVEQFINQGIPVEHHAFLNEISWGDLDGNKKQGITKEIYTNLLREWDNGNIQSKIPGGENPVEVQERLQKFIEYLLEREDDYILICTHGRALRILLCTVFKEDLSLMNKYNHENLCLYLLKYSDEGFTLVRSKDVSHLSDENKFIESSR